ncbi:MAG: ATP-binding protein [Rhodospirillaceae bacterium]
MISGSAPESELLPVLRRVAEALERLSPPPAAAPEPDGADAYVWHADSGRLEAVAAVNRVDLALLRGIARQRETLLANTRRFAAGLPANNALLWGARGMGKSSLVKAVHAEVCRAGGGPALVEIHREDIPSLPRLLTLVRGSGRRFILYCDDLSFDGQDSHYKSLKAVLEGGVEGRPENVVFYATSNRRHLMPREMIENERSTAINPAESVEEKVSLSDRFGLWLGFHNCDQETFFAMVEGYAAHFGLALPVDQLRARAVEWSVTRGSRSGRVAWQFIQDMAGELGEARRP